MTREWRRLWIALLFFGVCAGAFVFFAGGGLFH